MTQTQIVEVPQQDGIYGGIPESVYHGDKHSLSCSSAKELLKSPRKFDWARNHPKVQKTHFDLGHYVHGKVLGVGEPVVIIDYPDYKTKAAREERDQAYAEGKVPILADMAETGDAMAKALFEHETAGGLLTNPDAVKEHSAYWHDDTTRVRLRARFDLFVHLDDWLVIADVKTTSVSADPKQWGTIAAKNGLFIQDAWYSAAAAATGLGERIDFVFLNVETEPPHEVSITRLPVRARELGALKMRQAIDLFAECTANDHWPGYGPGIHTVDMPSWFYYQEEEEW
ncbi:Cas4 family exonuclease [Mycobacterium phage Piper2020]|nr:hypothetical protein SEA_MISHA28_64 [Mycobacterium phage Misha28]AVP42453.1 hypothetical protein SEA_TOOTSIEPOP_64 [Mycobacterium phage TootsiePop]QBP31746.1 Cas4 family exonuclease [Mycobacterium phage Piper2020]QKO03249.1 Cas4 family exonuclease [Mycobacterium phage Awesomesauce]